MPSLGVKNFFSLHVHTYVCQLELQDVSLYSVVCHFEHFCFLMFVNDLLCYIPQLCFKTTFSPCMYIPMTLYVLVA